MRARDDAPRDRDLDERPFGDSHFAAIRRDPRPTRKDRSHRAPQPAAIPPEASSRYAWHDGFFDDAEPRAPKRRGTSTNPRARR